MHSALTTLLDRLDDPETVRANVIPWGSPVPVFGDLSNSKVATLGLNPSRREFVDESGKELSGPLRRFHTLNSLGIASWADADSTHLGKIIGSCRGYFLHNPYETWFGKLKQILVGTNASYYDKSSPACHLDLIPYATDCRWTELSPWQRAHLLSVGADCLGIILRDSPIRLLVLNGRSVVDLFQDMSGVRLQRESMPDWSLSRRSRPHVAGYAYRGIVASVGGVDLGHELVVIGYNHNLQSSFGVTTVVVDSIRQWVSTTASEVVV